jgi:hypothetical protein
MIFSNYKYLIFHHLYIVKLFLFLFLISINAYATMTISYSPEYRDGSFTTETRKTLTVSSSLFSESGYSIMLGGDFRNQDSGDHTAFFLKNWIHLFFGEFYAELGSELSVPHNQNEYTNNYLGIGFNMDLFTTNLSNFGFGVEIERSIYIKEDSDGSKERISPVLRISQPLGNVYFVEKIGILSEQTILNNETNNVDALILSFEIVLGY